MSYIFYDEFGFYTCLLIEDKADVDSKFLKLVIRD